jgi:hypothetical protein
LFGLIASSWPFGNDILFCFSVGGKGKGDAGESGALRLKLLAIASIMDMLI